MKRRDMKRSTSPLLGWFIHAAIEFCCLFIIWLAIITALDSLDVSPSNSGMGRMIETPQ